MYAIIETGGKQYRVAAGDLVRVEEAEGWEPATTVRFDRVLFISGDAGVSLGTPTVANALVEGTVVRLGRAPKILVFKKKRRKQFRRTRGHRQDFAEVRIDALVLPSGERLGRPAAEPERAEKPPRAKKTAAPKVRTKTGPARAASTKKPGAGRARKKTAKSTGGKP